ncbi:unnamed protein product [Linum trigynum]|uniref:Secreted protein n=1 Tax=Linum trigynum TaxID=586398 RepID=A0AAV2ECQ5_9ROSI
MFIATLPLHNFIIIFPLLVECTFGTTTMFICAIGNIIMCKSTHGIRITVACISTTLTSLTTTTRSIHVKCVVVTSGNAVAPVGQDP